MNVLSCFDGMSCGQIALDRLGIKVDNYYASEIDKYAIQVTQKNYPQTIQLGDITKWREWDLPKIDLLIGGSPCQGFSFAGKQLNFDDDRSKLFFVFVDILKHYKPKYFLLENVVMRAEHNDVISGILGELYPQCVEQTEMFRQGRLEPIKINSALVSAQSRNRLYWTNIQGIEQPKDRGILLKDVIENSSVCDLVGYNGKELIKKSIDKGSCLMARDYKGFNLHGQTGVRCIQVGKADIKGHDSIKRVYSAEGKSPCLTTMGGGHREPKVAIGVQGAAIRNQVTKTGVEEQLNIRKDEKSNCVVASYPNKLNGMVFQEATKKGFVEAEVGDGVDLTFPNSKTRRGRLMKNKCNCLTAANYEYGTIETNLTWRKLTPLECERLQTVDDNYTDCVSNSQRYKMLGNGWTVDVIVHILNQVSENILNPAEKHICMGLTNKH